MSIFYAKRDRESLRLMSRSTGLFDETERPGQIFPLDTHMIIRDRYELAAELAHGKRALEIGCGAGLGFQLLSSVSSSFHAVEYSIENINFLRAKLENNLSIVRADAHELPFASDQFDLVVALAMVYYLDFERFVAEAYHVLAPDGILFFCTSNKDLPGFCAAPHTTRYFSVPELKNMLDLGGFECSVFGAFPASGGLAYRYIRACLKGIAKAIMTALPSGQKAWANLRLRTLEGFTPLPGAVEDMQRCDTIRIPLQSDRPDYKHRVIYVVAKKKSA